MMAERRVIDLKAEIAAQFRGEAPLAPVEELLGLRFVAWGEGESRWELDAEKRFHNPTGIVQGGILTALADVSMATAFISTLSPNEMFTTVELKINYLRPVSVGTISATGRVLHRGRTTGLLESVVADGNGKEVARATSTVLVLAQREDVG